MNAHDLIGRKFEVLDVNKTKDRLILTLKDLNSCTSHRFVASEEYGVGADSGWYSWVEVRFDGDTILKT